MTTRFHIQLANYFFTKPLYLGANSNHKVNIRKLDELPWQQMKSNNYKGLTTTMVDMDFFLALSNKDRFEIWRYWHSMPSNYNDFVSKYLETINKWRDKVGKTEKFELALNELSHFFYVSEVKEDSTKLFEEVYQLAKSLYKEGDIRIAIRQNNLAACYVYKHDYYKALELFECARPVFLKIKGRMDNDTWLLLEGIAVCKVHLKRLDEGIEELKKCLEFNRIHFGEMSHATANSMYNLADAYTFTEEYISSVLLFQEVLKIYSKILGIDHPLTIDSKERLTDWHNLSKLQFKSMELEQNNKFDESLEKYIELEDLCAELTSKPAMANCLFGKARILRVLGAEQEAIKEAKMALQFAEDSNKKLIKPLKLFINSTKKGKNTDFSQKSATNLKIVYKNEVPNIKNTSSNESLKHLILSRFKDGLNSIF